MKKVRKGGKMLIILLIIVVAIIATITITRIIKKSKAPVAPEYDGRTNNSTTRNYI